MPARLGWVALWTQHRPFFGEPPPPSRVPERFSGPAECSSCCSSGPTAELASSGSARRRPPMRQRARPPAMLCSASELRYAKEGVKCGVRVDGRARNELRSVSGVPSPVCLQAHLSRRCTGLPESKLRGKQRVAGARPCFALRSQADGGGVRPVPAAERVCAGHGAALGLGRRRRGQGAFRCPTSWAGAVLRVPVRDAGWGKAGGRPRLMKVAASTLGFPSRGVLILAPDTSSAGGHCRSGSRNS